MFLLSSFLSPLYQNSFINAILEGSCIGNRAFWFINLYSLNDKLLLEFPNCNAVAKLKDIKYKALKVFIEDLL